MNKSELLQKLGDYRRDYRDCMQALQAAAKPYADWIKGDGAKAIVTAASQEFNELLHSDPLENHYELEVVKDCRQIYRMYTQSAASKNIYKFEQNFAKALNNHTYGLPDSIRYASRECQLADTIGLFADPATSLVSSAVYQAAYDAGFSVKMEYDDDGDQFVFMLNLTADEVKNLA